MKSFALLTVCLAVGSAHAGVTVYTDRASWLAAIGGSATNIDFEGIVGPGQFQYAEAGSSLTIGGVDFGSPNRTVAVVDSAYFAEFYDWGTGAVMISYNDPGNIHVDLHSSNLAVGFDLGSILPAGDSITLTLGNGDTATATAGTNPNFAFLGVVSDSSFSTLRIEAAAGDPIIDNFSYSAVPEPGTMAALAVGALGVLRRRARK